MIGFIEIRFSLQAYCTQVLDSGNFISRLLEKLHFFNNLLRSPKGDDFMDGKPNVIIFMFMFLASLVAGSSLGASPPPGEEIDSTPCNPNALPDAKSILQYIAHLSSSGVKRAMVGQNCYHGDEITPAQPLDGYNNLVVKLHEKTGKWVSIVGVDYEWMKVFTPAELSSANRVLIAHWKKGGLVTVNLSPQNPWVNDESDIVNRPGNWEGAGSTGDKSGVDLNDLLDPSKPVSRVWRKKLDRVAAALSELQKAGVIVLFRPLEEMNGNWYWWGKASHPANPAPFVNLYRDMYDYFTGAKGLNNLLWVYSPFDMRGTAPECNQSDWAYPGDAYVDVIAPTCYSDSLEVRSYRLLLTMGNPRKPLAMGEWGNDTAGRLLKGGDLDTTRYIRLIKNNYPRIAYWVSWHSYPDLNWSLITNKNYRELMNDPDVITLDKLDWKGKR